MKKIVLFGDSLFNGFRHHRNTDLVRKNLQEKLGKDFDIINLSLSGATTVEGLDYLPQIPADSDLILIEYGTNDSSIVGISCENYRKNLETMIKFCDPKKVIIVSPWHSKPGVNYTIEQNLQENFASAKKLAQKYNCHFVNLWQITNGKKDIDQYYQNDGLHLTDLGNEQLVKLLITAIKKKLSN